MKALAEAQASAGHQVTVLVCASGKRTETTHLNGVTVIKAGRLATAASMPISWQQPLHLLKQQPDIVHLHSPYPLGEFSNWLLGRAKATVITHHSDVVRASQQKWLTLYAPLLKRILRAADCIIATSPRYIETSPWLSPVRDHCVVVPIGIDVDRFARRQDTPAVNPSPDNSLELLFVGRLRYYKGLGTLIRAMAETPQIHLTVVGVGPMEAEWRTLAGSLGVSDHITFAGDVEDSWLPDYFHRADLYVLPANARAEAYGIALVEAMAAGLPCITTEVGTGTSWLVQDGVTGFVVPPSDPSALAQAINTLRTDPTRRQQFAQAAQARARQNFSQAAMVAGVMAVYQRVLKDMV